MLKNNCEFSRQLFNPSEHDMSQNQRLASAFDVTRLSLSPLPSW